MDGPMDRQIDGWNRDGWTNGQTDRWMGQWTKYYISQLLVMCKLLKLGENWSW